MFIPKRELSDLKFRISMLENIVTKTNEIMKLDKYKLGDKIKEEE